MKTTIVPAVMLAALAALLVSVLAGCGTGGVSAPASPVMLTITAASLPDTAVAGQPVTYTATVQLTGSEQRFSRFGTVRGTSLYNVAAYGSTSGQGTSEVRTEVHTGTLTFNEPGTYTVTFVNSNPLITQTIKVL